MNETWLNSLQLHFRRLYPGQPTINIEQLSQSLKLLPNHDRNHFASYAIKSQLEGKNDPEDIVSFAQLTSRIKSTFSDKKDSIYLEGYFSLIDANGDGVISYEDLQAHVDELGTACISQKAFSELSQKLTHDSQGLGKNQFFDIMREYL